MVKKVSFVILFLLLLSGQATALTVTLMDSPQGFSQSLIGSIFFDSETFPTVDTTHGVNGTAVESEDDSDDLTAVAGQNILRPIVLEIDATEFEFDNTAVEFDATTLEFDPTIAETNIYFDNFFVSDKYNQYTSDKSTPNNDVFTFFFRGQYFSLVSGIAAPVSIKKIEGEDSFQSVVSFLNYGFNDTFIAAFSQLLTTNQKYRLKMAITAIENYALEDDSLKAASRARQPSTLNLEPSTLLFFGVVGLVVIAGGRRRRRRKL